MSTKNDGGPAFARPFSKNGEFSDSQQNRSQEGMSLRDYFAAKALVCMNINESNIHGSAQVAYQIADAMLAARSQP
jgi:hypothetical protein